MSSSFHVKKTSSYYPRTFHFPIINRFGAILFKLYVSLLAYSRDQDEFVASKRMDQTSFLYTGFGEMPWT